MFKKVLDANAKLVVKRPKIVLLIALVVTLLASIGASNLSMELNWVALAPEGSPAVEEYQEIINDFPSMDSIIVLVESDDYNSLKSAASEVEQKVGELDEYVASVVAGVDQDFMIENALLYMSEEEAQMLAYAFADKNAGSVYQFVYMLVDETAKQAAKGELTDEEISYAASMVRGLNALTEQTNAALNNNVDEEAIEDALKTLFAGDTLLTSPDGKMAMLTIQPTFDMMDETMLLPGVNAIEDAIKSVNDEYKNVTVRGTGMHVVARDEIESVMNDSYVSTLLSIILILALLYFSFRAWIAPIFTVTPLLFGIAWAMGIAGFTIGRLNMMTVFAVAMLLGLGVDYAIHMYSSYTERRGAGEDKEGAMTHAICHTGPSIIVGAMTTAVAFFALNISKLKILSELGTLMGIGIITTLAAVFWILPALIVVKKEKSRNIEKINTEFTFIGVFAKGVYKVKYIVLAVIVLGSGFMGYKASQIEFDMNLLNLEPAGLESIELMEHMVEEYDMSSSSFALQVDSLEKAYELHEKFEQVDHVSEVISVASILPKENDQEQSIENIEEIKEMLEMTADKYPIDKDMLELMIASLSDAVEELHTEWSENGYETLQEGDFISLKTTLSCMDEKLLGSVDEDSLNEFSEAVYDALQSIEDAMLSAHKISPSDLPDAYKSQFLSRDESKYLITVYPDFEIWEELGTERGKKFLADLAAVDEGITGTPIFMMDLYNAVEEELLLTGIVLILILLVILLLHFRSIKYALLAFLPLAFTLIYTAGVMSLLNIQLNMINFLVILLIIGIGLDDGVHILHHYKQGEHDIKRLFSTIGRAIFLTTVTTVFGFGSLSFSSYRGIAGLGVVLAIGVTLALIFTVIVLPIFLKDEADKKK